MNIKQSMTMIMEAYLNKYDIKIHKEDKHGKLQRTIFLRTACKSSSVYAFEKHRNILCGNILLDNVLSS